MPCAGYLGAEGKGAFGWEQLTEGDKAKSIIQVEQKVPQPPSLPKGAAPNSWKPPKIGSVPLCWRKTPISPSYPSSPPGSTPAFHLPSLGAAGSPQPRSRFPLPDVLREDETSSKGGEGARQEPAPGIPVAGCRMQEGRCRRDVFNGDAVPLV